jgi:hypothetical protein
MNHDPARLQSLEAEAFLQHLFSRLYQGPVGSWKSLINRALMAGHRPGWNDRHFDTFTDHLFDVLVEEGLLPARAMSAPLPALAKDLPESWQRGYTEARRRAAREAMSRTEAAYREEARTDSATPERVCA